MPDKYGISILFNGKEYDNYEEALNKSKELNIYQPLIKYIECGGTILAAWENEDGTEGFRVIDNIQELRDYYYSDTVLAMIPIVSVYNNIKDK